MAVRTKQAGVKNKREVDVRSASPGQGSTQSRRKTIPRDDEAQLRRTKTTASLKLGPAAKEAAEYQRGRIPPTVQGRKKAPSEMKLKHRGGPRKRTRLHGG